MVRCNNQDGTMILALNAGSSSLKATLMSCNMNSDKSGTTALTSSSSSLSSTPELSKPFRIASFAAERLSTESAVLHISKHSQEDGKESKIDPSPTNIPLEEPRDHKVALRAIWKWLDEKGYSDRVKAVGHRVVHGGTAFTKSTLLDDENLEKLRNLSHLAPLHNPHNIAGIDFCLNHHKENHQAALPQVAVFDTAFHSTIPEHIATYPIPWAYRKQGIRKYGFHGTSVQYIMQQTTDLLDRLAVSFSPSSPLSMISREKKGHNFIVCHLGNGASVTAVSDQKSVETSMGFTPLSGLMMGTRSGSVDPGIVAYACERLGKTVEEVLDDLNGDSGLKAIVTTEDSDADFDMRAILETIAKEGKVKEDDGAQTDKANSTNSLRYAELAVEMFVYRTAQHIVSSAVALPHRPDALIFTAGIGEHSAEIRQRVVEAIQHILPFTLEAERNQAGGTESEGVVSPEGVWPVVLVLSTDEEAMIVQECLRLVYSKS